MYDPLGYSRPSKKFDADAAVRQPGPRAAHHLFSCSTSGLVNIRVPDKSESARSKPWREVVLLSIKAEYYRMLLKC